MNWNILRTFVRTDFIIRYQNSFLGFVWVFLKPFLIFAVLLTIFSIFRQDILHFPLYLLLGIILFQFFADGTNFGMRSVLEKGSLLLKIPFPPHVAVLASLFSAALHLGFALILFFGFSFFQGVFPSLEGIFVFLVLLFVEFVWIAGFSFFAGLFVIRFRDLTEIWEVLLAALFYLTPIFYPLEIVPEAIRNLLWWNPLTQIIVFSRDAIIFHQIPSYNEVFLLLVMGIIFAIAGFLFFQSRIHRSFEKL